MCTPHECIIGSGRTAQPQSSYALILICFQAVTQLASFRAACGQTPRGWAYYTLRVAHCGCRKPISPIHPPRCANAPLAATLHIPPHPSTHIPCPAQPLQMLMASPSTPPCCIHTRGFLNVGTPPSGSSGTVIDPLCSAGWSGTTA